jgi:hypothetical protein
MRTIDNFAWAIHRSSDLFIVLLINNGDRCPSAAAQLPNEVGIRQVLEFDMNGENSWLRNQ